MLNINQKGIAIKYLEEVIGALKKDTFGINENRIVAVDITAMHCMSNSFVIYEKNIEIRLTYEENFRRYE